MPRQAVRVLSPPSRRHPRPDQLFDRPTLAEMLFWGGTISVGEAAELLGMLPSEIHRAARDGDLEAVKFGRRGHRAIDAKSVLKYGVRTGRFRIKSRTRGQRVAKAGGTRPRSPLLSVAQAAKVIALRRRSRRFTRQAVLAAIHRGHLPAKRVGKQWVIARRDARAYVPGRWK